MKFTVEETFKGMGVVHFNLSKHPQTVKWASSKDKTKKYILMGEYPYPEYIMKGIDKALTIFLWFR